MSFFEKSRNTGKINKKIEIKQTRIVHAIAGSLKPSEQKLEKKASRKARFMLLFDKLLLIDSLLGLHL